MKVYVVEEYLNDYPENGGGFRGIAAVFDSQEKAEEYCSHLVFLKIMNPMRVKFIMSGMSMKLNKLHTFFKL